MIRATSIVRTHRGTSAESRLAGVECGARSRRIPRARDARVSSAQPAGEAIPPSSTRSSPSLPRPEGRLIDVIRQLIDAVRSRLVYEKKVTTARTPVGEALRLGRGVCQDFAHLFLAPAAGSDCPPATSAATSTSPARSPPTPGARSGPAGAAGSTSTRPDGTFVGDDYVMIAIGRDYSDVPPNRGVWKGRADETIAVSVKVEPIERVPPDWSDWSAIQAPWSAASWIQSQPRSQRVKLNPQVGYRQQQGATATRSARSGVQHRRLTRILRNATGP